MDKIIKSATRWLLYLLALVLILYAIFPSWRAVTLGLALGLLASLMNAFLLQRRVGMISESVMQEGTQTRRKGLGLGSRIAMILCVAMLGYRFPDIINLPAALAGSMVMPFLNLAAAIIHNAKENNSGKG